MAGLGIVKQSMSDYAKWARKLGDGFMDTLQRGTVGGAARCVTIMQRRTREAIPANRDGKGTGGAVNTGDYLRGWKFGEIAPIGANVYNDRIHAAIIEAGRRVGKLPPPAVIMRWAQRKLGLSEKEAKKAAWPIARAIQTRGLLPRNVMTGGIVEMTDAVVAEQIRELEAAVGSATGTP